MLDAMIHSMGVPKAVFQGCDPGSYSGSYSAVAIFERQQGVYMMQWEKVIAPGMYDLANPFEFMYLLPLGKKLYARRYHRLPRIDFNA